MRIGTIFDRNGIPLAVSRLREDSLTFRREYPLGRSTSLLLGNYRFFRNENAPGLEEVFRKKILGIDGKNTFLNRWARMTPMGEDITTTIDSRLQKYAYSLLEGKKGAILGIDPRRGDILFMVSSPGFDPEFSNRPDSHNLNNQFCYATKGLFEPGSTFKVVVAAAAVETGKGDYQAMCQKTGFTPPGMQRPIFDYGRESEVHHKIGLQEAMEKSCNQYFAQLGLELGEAVLKKYADRLFFGKPVKWRDNNLLVNTVPLFTTMMPPNKLARSAFGQADIRATPFQMLMVMSAIANNGVLMKPGLILNEKPQKWGRALSDMGSDTVRRMMCKVVSSGTGKAAQIADLTVAGKTGTAQNEMNHRAQKVHAWFICCAPAENPRIAVVVLLANSGIQAGASAAPVAKKILLKARVYGYLHE